MLKAEHSRCVTTHMNIAKLRYCCLQMVNSPPFDTSAA